MANLKQVERILDDKNRQYMRNEAGLRDLYAAADDVLRDRGQPVTPTARAAVINASDRRVT